MVKIILFIAGIFLVAATLLPLVPKDIGWIRGFDFPRLQIASTIVILITAYPLLLGNDTLSDNIFFMVLCICLLYQMYMIYPYTPFSGKQVQTSNNHDDGSTFSILCTICIDEQSPKQEIKRSNPEK